MCGVGGLEDGWEGKLLMSGELSTLAEATHSRKAGDGLGLLFFPTDRKGNKGRDKSTSSAVLSHAGV